MHDLFINHKDIKGRLWLASKPRSNVLLCKMHLTQSAHACSDCASQLLLQVILIFNLL